MRYLSYYSLIIFIVAASACKKEGCTDINAANYDPEATVDDGSCSNLHTSIDSAGDACVLTGNITEDITLNADCKWIISGGVFVTAGTTLTIEPGTTIFTADDGTIPFLSILQGGKINACGTADNPIVFTPITSRPEPGAWGGIIINGNAPINKGTTEEGKGGTGSYGGHDSADNSGTLCYVRVEYAGMKLGDAREMKAFSFNACGSGTTLHHLQAFKCADDGFKFSGGLASLRYAIASACEDDGFDWTNGWSGNGQFWVAVQSSEKGDRGIEANNNSNDNTALPFSNPKLANITLIGADDGNQKNQGIKLREGTRGQLMNMIVTGFPKRGCHVDHDQTITNMADGTLWLKHSIIDNTTPFKFTNSDDDLQQDIITFNNPEYNNSIAEDGSLTSFLAGYVGTADGTESAAQLGDWFEPVTYIGAVPTNNDWTKNWAKEL